jgi:hypothetical protein
MPRGCFGSAASMFSPGSRGRPTLQSVTCSHPVRQPRHVTRLRGGRTRRCGRGRGGRHGQRSGATGAGDVPEGARRRVMEMGSGGGGGGLPRGWATRPAQRQTTGGGRRNGPLASVRGDSLLGCGRASSHTGEPQEEAQKALRGAHIKRKGRAFPRRHTREELRRTRAARGARFARVP